MKNSIKRYKLMGLLSELNRFAPHISYDDADYV